MEDITDPPLIHSWVKDALSAFADELQELKDLAAEEEEAHQQELNAVRISNEFSERTNSVTRTSSRNAPRRGKGVQPDETLIAAAERERQLQERLESVRRQRERLPYTALCTDYEGSQKIIELCVEPVKQRERKELDYFRSHHIEHFTMDDILDHSRFPIPRIKVPPLSGSVPSSQHGSQLPLNGSNTGSGRAGTSSQPAINNHNSASGSKRGSGGAPLSSPRGGKSSLNTSGRGGGDRSQNSSPHLRGGMDRPNSGTSPALSTSKKHVTLDLSSSLRQPVSPRGGGSVSAAQSSAAAAAVAAAAAMASTPPFIIDAIQFAKQHNQILTEKYGYKPVLNAESGLLKSPVPSSESSLKNRLADHHPGLDCALPPFFTETYPPTDHLPEAPSAFASNLPMTLEEFREDRRNSREGSRSQSSSRSRSANSPRPHSRSGSGGKRHGEAGKSTSTATPGLGGKSSTTMASGATGSMSLSAKERRRNPAGLPLGIECSTKGNTVVLQACAGERVTTMLRFTNRNADRHRLRVHASTDPWLVFTCKCMAPVAGRVERKVRHEMPVSCGGYIEVEVAFCPEHMFEPVVDTVLKIGVAKERNARNAVGSTWEFYEVKVRCETIMPKPLLYSLEPPPMLVDADMTLITQGLGTGTTATMESGLSGSGGAAARRQNQKMVNVLPVEGQLSNSGSNERHHSGNKKKSPPRESGGAAGGAWTVDIASVAVPAARPSSSSRTTRDVTHSSGTTSAAASPNVRATTVAPVSRSVSRAAGAARGVSAASSGAPTVLQLYPIEQIEFQHTFVMATTTSAFYIENVGSDALLTLRSTSSSYLILPHEGGAVTLQDSMATSTTTTTTTTGYGGGGGALSSSSSGASYTSSSSGSFNDEDSHSASSFTVGGDGEDSVDSPTHLGGTRSGKPTGSPMAAGGSGNKPQPKKKKPQRVKKHHHHHRHHRKHRHGHGEKGGDDHPLTEEERLRRLGPAGKEATAPFLLQRMEGTTFLVAFQPRAEGEVRGRLEVTVQEATGGDIVARHYFDLVGAGVVPHLELTKLGETVVESAHACREQWQVDATEENIPHYFVENATPNVPSTVVVEIQNESLVPLPFHWRAEANRTIEPSKRHREGPFLAEVADSTNTKQSRRHRRSESRSSSSSTSSCSRSPSSAFPQNEDEMMRMDPSGNDLQEDGGGGIHERELVCISQEKARTNQWRRRQVRKRQRRADDRERRANLAGEAGQSHSESDSESDMLEEEDAVREPEVRIDPPAGVLPPRSKMYFTVSVTPRLPVPLVTSYALFIEGLPNPSGESRTTSTNTNTTGTNTNAPLPPHHHVMASANWDGIDPAIVGLFRREKLIPSAQLCHAPQEQLGGCNADTYADAYGNVLRLIAPQNTNVEPDTFVTGFFVHLQPTIPTAVMVPQCFAETVDCLINYENARRATLHNRSPRPLHFYFDPTPEECDHRWPPHHSSSTSIHVIPRSGVLPPFSSKPVTVKFTLHHVGHHRESINLYIPEVMALCPPGAECSHKVELDVVGVGASVHTSTGMLDFGLIELGKEAEASFTVTNDNPVALVVDLQDPMMREPPRFVFIPPSFQLCPGDSLEVTVYRKAVSKDDAQTFFELVVRNGGTIAMETRATIQEPTLLLDDAVLNFGGVPEGVWQELPFYLSNFTALDNPFSLKLASPASPYVELAFERHHTIRAGQRGCPIKVRAKFMHHPDEDARGAADCYRALLGLRSQRNQQVLLVEVLCDKVEQLTMSVAMAAIRMPPPSTSIQAMTRSLQHFLPYHHAVQAMNPMTDGVAETAQNVVMVRSARWRETPMATYIRAMLWNLIDHVVLPSLDAAVEEAEEETTNAEHQKKATATTTTTTAATAAEDENHLNDDDDDDGKQKKIKKQKSNNNNGNAVNTEVVVGGSLHGGSVGLLGTVDTLFFERPMPLMGRPYHALCSKLCLRSELESGWPIAATSLAMCFQNYTGCVSVYHVEVLNYKVWPYEPEMYLAPDGGLMLHSAAGQTLMSPPPPGGESGALVAAGSVGAYSNPNYGSGDGNNAVGEGSLQGSIGSPTHPHRRKRKGERTSTPVRLTDGANSAVPLLQGESPSFWTTLINGVEARERANRQALAGAQERLLDGRGCSTLQCCSHGPVLPHSTVQLPVMMVTNLPGCYEEVVRVHFEGLRPPMDLPVRWEVEGKPILLDPTTSGLTTSGHHELLLMPSVIASVGASRRHLRLINRIPRDINVTVSIYLCAATFMVEAVDESEDASKVVLRLQPLTEEAKGKQSLGKGNAAVSPTALFMKANSTREIWLEYEPDIAVVQNVMDRIMGNLSSSASMMAAIGGSSISSGSNTETNNASPPGTRHGSSRHSGLGLGSARPSTAGSTLNHSIHAAAAAAAAGGRGSAPTTAAQEMPWEGSVVIHAEIADSAFNDAFLIDEFYEMHKGKYPSMRSLEGLRAGMIAAGSSSPSSSSSAQKSTMSRVSMLQVRRPLRSRQHVVRKNRVLFPSAAERYVLERAMWAKGYRLCTKHLFKCRPHFGSLEGGGGIATGGMGMGNTGGSSTPGSLSPSISRPSRASPMFGDLEWYGPGGLEMLEEFLRGPMVRDGSSSRFGQSNSRLQLSLLPQGAGGAGGTGGSGGLLSGTATGGSAADAPLPRRRSSTVAITVGVVEESNNRDAQEEGRRPGEADPTDSSDEEVDDSVAMLEAMAGGMRPIEDLVREEEERRELLFYLIKRREEVRVESHSYFTPIELLVRARCGIPCLDVQPSMEGVFFPPYHSGRWCGRTVRLTNYNSASVYVALEVDPAFRIASLNLIPSQVESDPLQEEDEPDMFESQNAEAGGKATRNHKKKNPSTNTNNAAKKKKTISSVPLSVTVQEERERKKRHGESSRRSTTTTTTGGDAAEKGADAEDDGAPHKGDRLPFPFATLEIDGRLVYRLQCGDALNVTVEVRDPEAQAAKTDPLYRQRVVLQGRLMMYYYDGSLRRRQTGANSAPGTRQCSTSLSNSMQYGAGNSASADRGPLEPEVVPPPPPLSLRTIEARRNRVHTDSPVPLVLQKADDTLLRRHSTMLPSQQSGAPTPEEFQLHKKVSLDWERLQTEIGVSAAGGSILNSPKSKDGMTAGGGTTTMTLSGAAETHPSTQVPSREAAPEELGRLHAAAEQQVRLFVAFNSPAVLTTPLATWFRPGQLVHDGRPQPSAVEHITLHNLMDESVRFRIERVPRAKAVRNEFAQQVLQYMTTMGLQGTPEHLTLERKMLEVCHMPDNLRAAEGDQDCFLVDDSEAFTFSAEEGAIPPATMGGMPGTTVIHVRFRPHSNVRYECFYRLWVNEKASDNFFMLRGDSRETEL